MATRSALALGTSLAALTVAGAAAFLVPSAAMPPLLVVVPAALAGGTAVFVLVFLAARPRRTALRPTDPDIVSTRLTQVEARVSEIGRQGPAPAGVDSIVADLGLLSGLVKSLADAMAVQDRDIAELRLQVERLDRREATSPARSALFDKQAPPTPERGRDDPAGRLAEMVEAARAATERRSGADVVPSLLPTARDGTEGDRASAPQAADTRRAAIRAAFPAGLEIALQPIVSLPQRRPRFVELLARLRLADGSVLAPAEFLPTLDAAGLLTRLDELVVSRALAVAGQLAGRENGMRVTCNLSPASLADRGFAGRLDEIVATRGTAAETLVLELPQQAWRSFSPETFAALRRLRSRGVAFAVDGVTEAQFADLRPAEHGIVLLKVPTALILDRLRPDGVVPGIAAVLRAVARAGARVVAERVESEDEIPDLIDIDIDLAQGFALGPPRAIGADATRTPGGPRNGNPRPGSSPVDPPPASALRRTA